MSCDADWIYLLKFSIFNTLQIDYFSGLLLSIQKAFKKWEEGPGCFAPQTLRELGQYLIDLKWVWHPIFRYIKCIQKRKKVCFLLCLILSDLGSIHCTPALCHISQLLLILKQCGCGSGNRSKVDTKIAYTHYLWDFIALYFHVGLTYKEISVLGSGHSFHISKRHLKRWFSATFSS